MLKTAVLGLTFFSLLCLAGFSFPAESSDFDAKMRASRARAEARMRQMNKKSASSKRESPSSRLNFDAARAPRPDLCFSKFVHAARQSTSMSQLYPYLMKSEVEFIKRQAIHSKNKNYLRDKWSRYRDIANSIVSIGKYDIKTDKWKSKARISVKRRGRAKIGGKQYQYRSSTVNMIGEDNYWKFSGVNDSGLVFN